MTQASDPTAVLQASKPQTPANNDPNNAKSHDDNIAQAQVKQSNDLQASDSRQKRQPRKPKAPAKNSTLPNDDALSLDLPEGEKNTQQTLTSNDSPKQSTQNFADFPIHPSILDGLAQMNWQACTPIQAQTLGKTLQGIDVAGKAKTGTGKTAAFLVAAYHYLMVNPVQPDETGPWCLILAPTRELAQQIYDDALQIGCYTGLQPVSILGGKDYEEQKQILEQQKPALIIGTPGRVIDLYKQKLFSLKQIDVLVLDEADRMFDLGFIQDIRYLLRQMPPASTRLNLIFSATFNTRVQDLAYEHLNAPELISVDDDDETEAKADIAQTLFHLEEREKPALLAGLLRQMTDQEKAIIFVNTKRILERLNATLIEHGFSATGLSGDLAQNQRERRLAQFKSNEKTILIATDVAARGLHIDDISHVFNYDLPGQAEDYIHRIGRTGRAGKKGIAISFCSEGDAYHLPEIETRLKQKIPTQRVNDDLLDNTVTLLYVKSENTSDRGPRRTGPRTPRRSTHARSAQNSAQGQPNGNRSEENNTDN